MESTRDQILGMIVRLGPITAGDLAERLELTPAGIRRHVVALEDEGSITEHAPAGVQEPKRGRPARYYVATDEGRETLQSAYSDLANATIRYLEEELGPKAVEAFAEAQMNEIEKRYAALIAAAGDDLIARARALTDALTADGYAATLREVGDGFALQLCQGHCPVLQVAEQFPQLCRAETEVFSRLLDLHVQRLATLAEGEHVCTTNIPLTIRRPLSEGTR